MAGEVVLEQLVFLNRFARRDEVVLNNLSDKPQPTIENLLAAQPQCSHVHSGMAAPLDLVFDPGGTQRRVKMADIDIAGDDVHEMQNLLLLKFTRVLILLDPMIEWCLESSPKMKNE